jgi:hypothetical protein
MASDADDEDEDDEDDDDDDVEVEDDVDDEVDVEEDDVVAGVIVTACSSSDAVRYRTKAACAHVGSVHPAANAKRLKDETKAMGPKPKLQRRRRKRKEKRGGERVTEW